mmetsp:Transcript_55314/g.134347  ORF Transcript_55314/g.134347 Transcript_55314/m.134347 type:complete len:231 (-) Transcript_55314:207-899(-)
MAACSRTAATATAKGMKRAIFSIGNRITGNRTNVGSVRQVPLSSHLSPLSSSSIIDDTYRQQHRRSYASAQQQGSSGNNAPSAENNYISPFQDIFDTIDEGKTFLGTSEFQMPAVKLLRCGIPEHVLKFKTTSYGRYLEEPFVSPNEHKITLQCHIRHIPFESDAQRLVLKEIVGNRLNDETGVLQLSSSQFGSRIENKRHAVSMLERIVETAKTLAARVEEEVQAADAA